MNINRQLKKYYRSRIEAQKVPQLGEIFQREIELPVTVKYKGEFVLNLVFHVGLVFLLALTLVVNSNTFNSLQKLDPDNQKSYLVQKKVKKGFDQIKAYLKPNPAPVK